jgi:GTPase SAR1 family protein
LDSKARQNQILHIHKFGESVIDKSVINQLTNLQNDYKIYNDCFEDESMIFYKSEIFTAYLYDYQQQKIVFFCYNTSYISEIHEQPGEMFFPVNQLPNIFSNLDADLFISVLHHPFNWYSPINRREFETHIHETSDFYITGHEHEPSAKLISDLQSNFVYHLEGTVLQETGNPNKSEFNIISFDIEKKEFLYNTAIWAEGSYHIQIGKPSTSYVRGKLKVKSKYAITENYESFINDAGGKFTHPSKSDLKLEDVYVYPKLKQFNEKIKSEDENPFILEDSESIIKNLSNEVKLLILGNENIGKTSLLKTTFNTLFSKGLVPIFLNGENIKNAALDEIIKLVQKTFIDIYGNDNIEDFHQEDIEKIYILIDDIDKSPLKNKKAKGRLFENISKHYKNIIITGNELFPIEEILTDEVTSADLFSSFRQYEILEFNQSYKNKLIQKWYTLGLNDFHSEDEIWKKCDEANKAINIAMGNKIVPNYPIFILILLQALETSTGHNLQLSSYGNYYQLLILKSFSEKITDQAELTLYQNYCSELANFFFDKKAKTITELEFIQFHKDVTSFEKFDLPTLTHEKAKKTLVDIGVLDEWNDQIDFKYQYIYYFFQAKFFAQNISKSEIKEKISSLCKRLYRTEFANIIMFLIHFSKEDFILDELLKNAMEVFNELHPCKLENDIQEVQTLLKELPKIYLEDRSIEDVRKTENEIVDKREESNYVLDPVEKEMPDHNEDVSKLDILSKLNLAFKIIEILGQILKNNYGALQGQIKYDLLKETYLLGLRSLNSVYTLISGNTDFMLNQLKTAIKKEKDNPSIDNPINEEEIEKKARQIVFSMCSHISRLFIKKISDAIGTDKFADKFERIEGEFNYISVQLTNYQIKLDQGKGFPNRELPKLKKAIEQYPLSYFVLKQMVTNHLHRNPVDYKDKQRICEFLSIPIQKQIKFNSDSKKEKIY